MVSLGCPKNLVDGESMLGLLRARGYETTSDSDLADLIIVNTCGFIDAAKKESIDAILEMADKKNTGRCAALIVTGCLSERFRDFFSTELPEVDAALGTGEYGRICEIVDIFAAKIIHSRDGAESRFDADLALKSKQEASPRTVHESSADQRLGHLNAPRVLTGGAGCVYIKIAEGCDNNCAYCVIPSVRGPYINRPPGDIIAEARRLSADREIEAVLVAQDTTHYGEGDNYAGAGDGSYAGDCAGRLCGLLDELSRIERVKWIRLMYAYPDRIDSLLIEQFTRNKKLLKYLDLPIQHASDNVLHKMGRRYGREDLTRLIAKLRREVPGIVLRTTLITGFPGENEEDFAGLMDFITAVKFERIGVFVYSKEEGTRAALMDGQVPRKTALKRRAALLRTQAAITRAADASRIGREYEAITESGPPAAYEAGAIIRVRTYAEAPEIDGTIRVTSEAKKLTARVAAYPGTFVKIRITGMDARGLLGAIIL